MSTTTMMSNQNRRLGPPGKRKERDGFDVPTPKLSRLGFPKPGSPNQSRKPPEPPASRNQLLAGYLAHEFLTKGTLFGQSWAPARAEAVPVSAASSAGNPNPSGSSPKQKPGGSSRPDPRVEKNQRYVEVADLLKTDGAHLPGIVNPTELASFLQL